MRVKPPKKCITPYGGRLAWTLPGRNRLTVHLKDKNKIRPRKRWSQVCIGWWEKPLFLQRKLFQVMYMYYLLGHRLMEKIDDVKRKETVAENTYILTLDGDVDFQPSSVHLLVDLMKKNRRLGAACGRIHPRGSGTIIDGFSNNLSVFINKRIHLTKSSIIYSITILSSQPSCLFPADLSNYSISTWLTSRIVKIQEINLTQIENMGLALDRLLLFAWILRLIRKNSAEYRARKLHSSSIPKN